MDRNIVYILEANYRSREISYHYMIFYKGYPQSFRV
jgi:hypothetical protein